MSNLIIPDKCVPYIRYQRSRYKIEKVPDPEEVKRRYAAHVAEDFAGMEPHLPEHVGSILEIGCVDRDTEYLSRTGWKRIADYDGGEVLQCTADGVGSWVTPKFIKLPCEGFHHFKTKYGINQMLSDEHRVLCWRIKGSDSRREREVVSAESLRLEHDRLVLGAKVEFKTTFEYPFVAGAGLGISDASLRVQVMAMADAHMETGSRMGAVMTVRVKKDRKIARALTLLEDAKIKFTTGVNKEGATWFRFDAPIATKTYDGWMEKCSLAQIRIIAEECLLWDGNWKDRCFYTRDLPSAEFIQFAFTVTGHRSVLRADNGKDGEIDYRVFSHDNPMVGLSGQPKTPIQFVPSADGFKYCFTTETGFWVMRRGGNIALTGNCGMAALQVFLKRKYPDARLELLDGDTVTAPGGGGYSDKPDIYNSREITELLLEANGVHVDRWYDIGTKELLEADLIISMASCGYHYAVNTYRMRGLCIMDLRRSVERQRGKVIFIGPKYDRCMWHEDSAGLPA